MPKKVSKVVYTARNARAEILEMAGESYPDSELKVTITPIEDEASANKALEEVKKRNRPNNVCITDELWGPVEERYRKLGESGTDSLVEMYIPGGVENFDFGGFYAQADEVSF